MQKMFKLELGARKMITPTVLHLEFKIHDHENFHFTPGQFITFHFEREGQNYSRSYSIASIPTETSAIEIAVSPFAGGAGTEKLFNLKIGDLINTSGPFGRLVLRDEQPNRYILVATGTGVTPYRAMLPELIGRIASQGLEAHIILGVKTRDELLYGADFLAYASKAQKLHFDAFYSREKSQDLKDYEHIGYVQSAFENLNLNPQEDVIYLCGNPNMIDESFALLREKGFETAQIRREKYISPKK